jgi:hypothetical protein
MAVLRRTALEIEGMKIEPRLARSLEKALRKIQASISIFELGSAIQSKDVSRAMALIPESVVRDALVPCVRIIEDAVAKGGRISAGGISKKARNG